MLLRGIGTNAHIKHSVSGLFAAASVEPTLGLVSYP